MAISGSFVRGDSTGRVISFSSVYNRLSESSSLQAIQKRNRSEAEVFVLGAAQGIAIGDSGTVDGNGSFGRYIQIGVNKETTDGFPTTPSLRLDYPGNMWRFRWVVKSGPRTIKISTNQNSTGSYRPSMVIRANPNINIPYDLSASAADGAGWATIGPISFTTSGSDVLWVELHNNNYGIPNMNGGLTTIPAYFDHIVVT